MTENFISTDPLVDGSGLTTNPEIKLRRRRVLSESGQIAPGRPVKIAEFVNACRFLAGDTDKPFPLSSSHYNLLSLIRNNHEIPENYASAINSNLDIVLKAAALKPSEVKSKYFIANHITNNKKSEPKTGNFIDRLENWSKQVATNPISSNNTICTDNLKKEKTEMTNTRQRITYDEQTKKSFMQYLEYRIGKADMPDVPTNLKFIFTQNVGRYLRNKKTACNKDLRSIMSNNENIMTKILEMRKAKETSKNSKKITPKTDYVKTKLPENTVVTVATPKLPENAVVTVATPKFTTIDTTIFDLIKMLKSAGLTEVTFKF